MLHVYERWLFSLISFWSLSGLAYAFVNGQNATYVLGQANFTSNVSALSQSSLGNNTGGGGVAYDPSTARLFVGDTGNARIMIYDLSGTITNGMPASGVLGQPDFTSQAYTLDASHFTWAGMAIDAADQWLFVADSSNNRVLIFDISPGTFTNGMAAKAVLGQPDFTSNSGSGGGGCVPGAPPPTASGFYQNGTPTGVAYDSTARRLYVTDYCNDRVLVFNLPSTLAGITNGMSASDALNQPSLTSSFNNTLAWPQAVAYDPTNQRLFATSSGWVEAFNLVNRVQLIAGGPMLGFSNYVLGWAPYMSYQSPTIELGQWLYGLAFDEVQQHLFVGAQGRVLEFDLSGGIVDWMNPSHILGQPSFLSTSYPTTQSSLRHQNSLAYDSVHQRLFVDDGNRVMIFYDNLPAATPQIAPNACPNGPPLQICGTVTASAMEDLLNPLTGVPIQLLNASGAVLSTQKSNGLGRFSFTSLLTTGATYFIAPVVGRAQTAAPLVYPIQNLPSTGALARLQIYGWPGAIQVNSTPGTAVIISTFNYSGANAPTISASSLASLYSTSIGQTGVSSVPLPMGSYYVTCWVAQMSGGTATFNRSPTKGPETVTIGQTTPVLCN